MKKQDFFNKGLPKWPGMVVVGTPVTKEQAAEILVRTNVYLSCNDNSFNNEAQGIIYEVDGKGKTRYDEINEVIIKKLGVDEKNFKAVWDYKESKERELGKLDVYYLANSRICSSWIGGPHGWCNWNGQIGCNNYNIGKWPSVEDVYKEWEIIAEAFPYLDLKCQLMNHEASCEDSVENPGPVIEYRIKDGKVKMVEPKKYLQVPVFPDLSIDFLNPMREIGCTIERLEESVKMVRDKMKSSFDAAWKEIKTKTKSETHENLGC